MKILKRFLPLHTFNIFHTACLNGSTIWFNTNAKRMRSVEANVETDWTGRDSHLRTVFFFLSTIDEQIIQEKPKANKHPKGVATGNGSSLPRGTQNSGFELETTVVSTATTVVSGVATPSTRRRRKKKMPCSRQHYQFNYLDEGILLEDKPLSSAFEHLKSYSYVTVDTSPVCTCHHNGYLEAGFDLLPYSRDYFTPVSSTPSRGSRYSSRQGLMVLPESFVWLKWASSKSNCYVPHWIMELITDSSVNEIHWNEALISDSKVEWSLEIKIAYQRPCDAQRMPMHYLGSPPTPLKKTPSGEGDGERFLTRAQAPLFKSDKTIGCRNLSEPAVVLIRNR